MTTRAQVEKKWGGGSYGPGGNKSPEPAEPYSAGVDLSSPTAASSPSVRARPACWAPLLDTHDHHTRKQICSTRYTPKETPHTVIAQSHVVIAAGQRLASGPSLGTLQARRTRTQL